MRRSARIRLTLLPLLASAALAASPAAAQTTGRCADGSDDCTEVDQQINDGQQDSVVDPEGVVATGGYVSGGFGRYFGSGG